MRILAGALAMAIAATGAVRAAEREVQIDVGKAALHGTLSIPEGAAKGPAVLLISGSGPTDRDGNTAVAGVRPATQKLMAAGLAAAGIASLRFDKRGLAASAGAMAAESELRFTTYVDDAVAWTRFLAAQPGVTCVVLAGHSEGALIAAMAAQRTPVCGVVEIAGAGRPAGVVLREQLKGKLPAEMIAPVEHALSELEAGRQVPDPPMPALFRAGVQPYMISWLPIDPAAELRKAKAPVLILQGDHDLQVSMDDAHALAAARPDAEFRVLAGANHVLKDAPLDPQANMAAYADPSTPLDPAVVPAVAAFVKRAGAGH